METQYLVIFGFAVSPLFLMIASRTGVKIELWSIVAGMYIALGGLMISSVSKSLEPLAIISLLVNLALVMYAIAHQIKTVLRGMNK
jgi:hypothetical protein